LMVDFGVKKYRIDRKKACTNSVRKTERAA
jgi:hypothetical protein